MTEYQLFIGGKWVPAVSGDRFDSTNPFTEEVWTSFPRAGVEDVDLAVRAAHVAFHSEAWRGISASQRGALLRKLAELVASNVERLATLESTDNGKVISETRPMVGGLPDMIHYYAGLADKIEGSVIPIGRPGLFTYTKLMPMGVAAIITPWNSPLLIAAGKMVNALAAGCAVVVKPSEFTSATTIELVRLCEQAGFPAGIVNVVTGFGHEIGDALVTHPMVSKVSFTGGTETGKRINEMAARSLKSVTLELGGKSPNIIFDDANLENAARGAIGGIFAASGQSCVAGSRLLVQASVYDQVVERLVELGTGLRIGDPLDPATHIGPVTTPPQFKRVASYLESGKADGASCVLGGHVVEGKGSLVQPTIFANVANSMRIAQEEIFGPVLSVIPFADEDEAISIANDTLYGLASGVWTSNMKRMMLVADRIQAGTVWVNMYRASSFMMPLTGWKNSGLGSENGMANIRNFLQPRAVWMNYSDETPLPFKR